MKKIFLLCSLTFLALPALAIDGRHVKYVGGTLPGVNVGAIGHIDTTAATTLTFEYSGNKVAIPYASITRLLSRPNNRLRLRAILESYQRSWSVCSKRVSGGILCGFPIVIRLEIK